MTLRITFLIALACIAACGADQSPETSNGPDDVAATDQAADDDGARPEYLADDENPSAGDILPMPFRVIWEPWQGDFEGMVERRFIRAVVPFGGYQFYYDDGLPKGATYELLQRMDSYINEELGLAHRRSIPWTTSRARKSSSANRAVTTSICSSSPLLSKAAGLNRPISTLPTRYWRPRTCWRWSMAG